MQIKYSSTVNWNSRLGEVIQLSESGSIAVLSSVNTVQISPLTPGTTYNFSVTASTSDKLGQEALISGKTDGDVTNQGDYYIFLLVQYVHFSVSLVYCIVIIVIVHN